MTYEEAYRAGFCKTAEDMGFDPDLLLKLAQTNSVPASAKSPVLGLFRRLGNTVRPFVGKSPQETGRMTGNFIAEKLNKGVSAVSNGYNRASQFADGLRGGYAETKKTKYDPSHQTRFIDIINNVGEYPLDRVAKDFNLDPITEGLGYDANSQYSR